MPDELSRILADRLDGSIAAIESLRDRTADLETICGVVVRVLEAGGTVFTCGNGGSAAEAMHLSEELIGRYRSSRRSLPAVCLNADGTALTCIANDFGFDQVFARQCESLVKPQDVLIIFSTSGNSQNVVNAAKAARAKSASVIGLLGGDGGQCLGHCTHSLIIPSEDSAHVQEAHQVVLHMVCELVEHAFEG